MWWTACLFLESFTDMDNNEQFQAGRLAMQFVGSWNMSAYTTNEFIKDKFDQPSAQGKVPRLHL